MENEKNIIAVFGGSFNPPLNSHFSLGQQIVNEYENIDKNVIYDSESKLDNVENIEQDFGFEFDLENDDEE